MAVRWQCEFGQWEYVVPKPPGIWRPLHWEYDGCTQKSLENPSNREIDFFARFSGALRGLFDAVKWMWWCRGWCPNVRLAHPLGISRSFSKSSEGAEVIPQRPGQTGASLVTSIFCASAVGKEAVCRIYANSSIARNMRFSHRTSTFSLRSFAQSACHLREHGITEQEGG
jgi:hypothetical protein